MAIVMSPNNVLPHIDGLYAFLSKDGEGNEGLCAVQYKPGQWMPLIAADVKRLEDLMPAAQEIAKQTNKDVILVKFSGREEITRITGESNGPT